MQSPEEWLSFYTSCAEVPEEIFGVAVAEFIHVEVAAARQQLAPWSISSAGAFHLEVLSLDFFLLEAFPVVKLLYCLQYLLVSALLILLPCRSDDLPRAVDVLPLLHSGARPFRGQQVRQHVRDAGMGSVLWGVVYTSSWSCWP